MNTPALAKLQTLCQMFPEVFDISPVTQGALDWTCSMRTTHGEYQLVGMSGYPTEVWFADEAGESDPQLFYLRTAFMMKVETILNNKVLDENKIH